MKRTCKNNINRNRSVFSQMRNNNLVTPEILVNQIWMQEEEASGVKIIELNSSSGSSKDSNNHSWSYVINGRHDEQNNYSVNEEARRRRRTNIDNENYAAAYANQYLFDPGMQSTNAFYGTYETDFINAAPMNHPMNCFTIIDNHLKSESSTDSNYEGVEVIELDKTEEASWDHVYKDEALTYEPNKPSEKRTIWIYSYKNKRLLSENDFELVNIPGKDESSASTLCSISDEELKADRSPPNRLGSPIPATYIPKLDLSLVQTLSTVTEISEPNKPCSKESPHEVVVVKPKNNWLTERNDEPKKVEKSSVVNWMALSPRERRRRSINTNFEVSLQNIKETEITYAEGNEKIEQNSNRPYKLEASTVEVQVDIHANENSTKKEVESPKSLKTKANQNEKKIVDIIPMKISFADADNEIEESSTILDYSKKPSIEISCKRTKRITDPIENLESNDWIVEETEKKSFYDYGFEKCGNIDVVDANSDNVVDSASRRLWLRNMQLMQAPRWNEYLPITSSPPSLRVSLSLSSLNGKKSWFTRLTRCMKCCK